MDVIKQKPFSHNRWFRLLTGLVFVSGVLLLASTVPEDKVEKVAMRVVIDAGHGGKDPGNLGTGRYKVTEKTVALNVSKLVGKYIERAFPEVEVLYTREDDTFVPLHERTKFANSNAADLFISIHCDAFTRESAMGCGSYVMGPAKTEANLRMAQKENAAILLEDDHGDHYGEFDPNSPEGLIELSLRQNAHIHQSLRFAQHVQDQMRERVGRVDRGVRQAPFWVISFTTMPSVLIELGFLTNKAEEDFLMSSQGQDYMASAIYRAFKQYKADIESVENTMGEVPDKTDRTSNDDTAEPEAADEKESTAVENPSAKPVFKVQLLSSSKEVEITPENFMGLEGVELYRDNGTYKYLYGRVGGYEEAKTLQKKVRETGFRGAFIVAFDKDGQRMALEKAIEETKKRE